jgi:hypothetical protein
VRFFNGAFNSFTSYVDNVTWNDVPAPGAFALAVQFKRRVTELAECDSCTTVSRL